MFYCGLMKVEKLKKCNVSNAGIALNNKNKVFVMDGSHSWFGYGVIRGGVGHKNNTSVIFHVLGTIDLFQFS